MKLKLITKFYQNPTSSFGYESDELTHVHYNSYVVAVCEEKI